MKTPTLLLRADGTQQSGTGHFMRCLALAQAWQVSTGGTALFVTAAITPALATRLQDEDVPVVHLSAPPGSREDAQQTIAYARQSEASWVALDGYHFGAEYQNVIKTANFRLLAIDDYGHAEQYAADIILNQNLHADEQCYRDRQPYTRLLLGSRYMLLRQEFVHHGPPVRTTPAIARHVLVTLGGSDPENVTTKVLHALQHDLSEDFTATVILGGSNPHVEHVQAFLRHCPEFISVKRDVKDMSDDMRQADIAIAAAGATAWELAFMGLPCLLLAVANNQCPIAARLAEVGFAVNLGWHRTCTPSDISRELRQLKVSAEARRAMACRGQALIDGHGAARAVMAMTGEPLRVRKVCENESRLLWEWANDPDTRAVSFSSAPIPWQEHLEWFHTKIKDPRCYFFIATDTQDVPVGQVRFDVSHDEATISVGLDRHQRGKGYGSLVLRLSANALFATTQISTVHAYIKPDNHASLRAFAKAGYTPCGTTETAEQPAVHFVLRRRFSL